MQLSFARKGSRFTLVISLGLLTFACGDDDGGAPLPSGDAGTDAAVVDVTDTTDTTETGSDTTDTNTDTSIATTDTGLDTTDTVTSDTDITVVLDGGVDTDTTADLDADVTTDPGTTTDGADAEAPDAGQTRPSASGGPYSRSRVVHDAARSPQDKDSPQPHCEQLCGPSRWRRRPPQARSCPTRLAPRWCAISASPY